MSIILMLNEKFRENVPPWEGLMQRAEAMPGFFQRVLTLKEGRELQQHEKVHALHSPHSPHADEEVIMEGLLQRVLILKQVQELQ